MSKRGLMHGIDHHGHQEAPPPDYAEASASTSSMLSPTESFQPTFACISLNMTDVLRLIRFPPRDVPLIEEVVRSAWPRGVQSTRVYGVSHEIKLKGTPWSGVSFDKEKVAARFLMSSIFRGLYDMGWILKASASISKKERDKDSLLFRFQSPAPPPCDWLSISFTGTDKINIVSSPNESEAPDRDLCEGMVRSLGTMIQRHQPDSKGSYEIKLAGEPWMPSGRETVTARIVALTLLDTLENFGFNLYAVVDQDTGHHGAGTDTWHCCRLKGWQSGQPVWHS